MVGFVKELVDGQCAGSIAVGRHEQFRLSNFETLLITECVVFVTKMAPSLSASPNPMPAGEGPAKRRFHKAWEKFTFRRTGARSCCLQARRGVRSRRIGSNLLLLTNFGFIMQITGSS
jgi:hypothetical protein